MFDPPVCKTFLGKPAEKIATFGEIMKPRYFQNSQSRILLTFLLLALSSAWAQNPVPSISTPLFPDTLAPGGPSFVLTVDGSGFVSTSVVEWNGTALPTTFVSSHQLKVVIPSADIVSPGTAWITVSNGGITSNVGYFEVTNATTSVSFNQSLYAVGNGPNAIASGDFNGDGKLDLAVVNTTDGTVSILLGNGEGTFQPAVAYEAGNMPNAIAVGDFNGDGKLDLAILDSLSGGNSTVTILLGNGDGTFTAASVSPFFTGAILTSIAVGDFDGDGNLDLAVAYTTNVDISGNIEAQANVSILRGNGDGTFGSPLSVWSSLGVSSLTIAVGDFNNDGKLDVVTTDSVGEGVVLAGNGDGTFQSPVSSSISLISTNSAVSIAVGDFNGDGDLDFAARYPANTTVGVLLGKGNGSFGWHFGSIGPLTTAAGIAVGDLDGDGSLDLVAVDASSGTAYVLLGKGDGTFLGPASFSTASSGGGVVAGDFNRDGRMDLAVVNPSSNEVSILLQPTPAPPPGGSDITDVTAGSGLSGGGTSGDITLNNTGLLSLAAGTGLFSSGGQTPTLSLNTSFTDGRYLQLTGGTLTGGLFAPSFSGNGANLSNLNPASLVPGMAGINITGNAATATLAASATNAFALGGVGPGGYAPSSGSSSYIQNNSGPAQTANVNISGNAGIGGNANVTGNVATTGTLTVGGTGTPIKGHISILVNPNFPALKGATCATANFAFGGAADGDTIALGVPNERMSANATVIYTAWVSAANTVTLQACDILGTQKTAGTGSIRIDLWKH